MDKYGPFINIVAIASALVAVFGVLLLKMVGNTSQWTRLLSDLPAFLVAAGPRALAVALMAITYVIIDQTNYLWFGIIAVLSAILCYWGVIRFDRLRRLHIAQIPLVGKNGKQLLDRKNNPRFENVVVGLESNLRSEARAALEDARKKKGGVSLLQFMAGYGAQKVNDPEVLWDRELLVNISNRLLSTLMVIILSAVMVIFLAAFIIEVAT